MNAFDCGIIYVKLLCCCVQGSRLRGNRDSSQSDPAPDEDEESDGRISLCGLNSFTAAASNISSNAWTNTLKPIAVSLFLCDPWTQSLIKQRATEAVGL